MAARCMPAREITCSSACERPPAAAPPAPAGARPGSTAPLSRRGWRAQSPAARGPVSAAAAASAHSHAPRRAPPPAGRTTIQCVGQLAVEGVAAACARIGCTRGTRAHGQGCLTLCLYSQLLQLLLVRLPLALRLAEVPGTGVLQLVLQGGRVGLSKQHLLPHLVIYGGHTPAAVEAGRMQPATAGVQGGAGRWRACAPQHTPRTHWMSWPICSCSRSYWTLASRSWCLNSCSSASCSRWPSRMAASSWHLALCSD